MTRRMTPTVDPSLLEPLGQLTVNFNILEQILAFFVWNLIGHQQIVGQIVTAGMPFRRIVDLFCSLFRYRFTGPTELTALADLRKRIEDVEANRNAFVHSVWAGAGELGTGTRLKMTARAKRGLEVALVNTRADEIEALAELAGAVWDLAAAPLKIEIQAEGSSAGQ